MTAPAPAAPPAAPASGGGLAQLEASLGGPKRAAGIGLGVLVGGFALYKRHQANQSKAAASTAAAEPDTGATTDANSLDDGEDINDYNFLIEQQAQGSNPVPPPTTVSTPPPTAPTPPIRGGNPPHKGNPIPVNRPPSKPTGPQLNESYTVVKGDTLWGIAKRFLGNGEDYKEIYAANKSVIGPDPNKIYPGEKLRV